MNRMSEGWRNGTTQASLWFFYPLKSESAPDSIESRTLVRTVHPRSLLSTCLSSDLPRGNGSAGLRESGRAGNRKRLEIGEIVQFEVNGGVSCGMPSAVVLGRAR